MIQFDSIKKLSWGNLVDTIVHMLLDERLLCIISYKHKYFNYSI